MPLSHLQRGEQAFLKTDAKALLVKACDNGRYHGHAVGLPWDGVDTRCERAQVDSGHNPPDCRIAVEVSGGADVVEGLGVMPIVSQEDKKAPLMTRCASLKSTNVSRSSPISLSFVPVPHLSSYVIRRVPALSIVSPYLIFYIDNNDNHYYYLSHQGVNGERRRGPT